MVRRADEEDADSSLSYATSGNRLVLEVSDQNGGNVEFDGPWQCTLEPYDLKNNYIGSFKLQEVLPARKTKAAASCNRRQPSYQAGETDFKIPGVHSPASKLLLEERTKCVGAGGRGRGRSLRRAQTEKSRLSTRTCSDKPSDALGPDSRP